MCEKEAEKQNKQKRESTLSNPFALAGFGLEVAAGVADLLLFLSPRGRHRSAHKVLGAVRRIGPHALALLGAHLVGRSPLALVVLFLEILVLFVRARRANLGGRHHARVVLENRLDRANERKVALAAHLAREVVQIDRPEHGTRQLLLHNVLGFDLHRLDVVVASPREVLFAFGVRHQLRLVPELFPAFARQHHARLVIGHETTLAF